MALAELIFTATTLIPQASASADSAQQAEQSASQEPTIIVTAPKSDAERRKELREMARNVIRPPRQGRPIARFFYPVCPKVVGLDPASAEAIEARIRANAEEFGIGANPDRDCTATVRVAFMSTRAGPPESWLSYSSPALAHLVKYQRQRVLEEDGPVRAWNKTKMRDFDGRPIRFDEGFAEIKAHRGAPIVTNEITGAAVLIGRKAAEGKSVRQLADYASIRSFVGTGAADGNALAPAQTILALFQSDNPPSELTTFDRALISQLYSTSKNSWQRRVYLNVAAQALRSERESAERED
ncbi:MAG: hypothetical protein AAF250_10200 [Pseudomonadota bacterium]